MKHRKHHKKKKQSILKDHHKANLKVLILSSIALIGGIILIWLATLKTPDFNAFNDRIVASSTKIYDRTGEVLLYDIHEDVKRNVVPFEEISIHAKNATVAIEDSEFYEHNGIKPKAILRAVLANLKSGEFSQGGSTLTQQIVKNTLLTQNKRVSRKLKEWILAVKVEREFSKEQILEIYLNEAPYGGSIYGIQEASKTFFDKDAKDVTLAEAAYLAAIPNAPTFFSPYGQNKDRLDERKNLVLSRMKELGFISDEEYLESKDEVVEFLPREDVGIKAPHFVFWVREYLEEKYGREVVLRGGLNVKTTLDWGLQEKAEEIVTKHAEINTELHGATNAALVAIDPKTGQVLSMVGSRDYFDKEIDGNFNVTTAQRQPGSSFKPFVYATAFKKGFEPQTTIFDTKTEFNPDCLPDGSETEIAAAEFKCYHPRNYDNKYLGPMSLKNALAQSRNVPAVKLLYLTSIRDSIKTAQDMGLSTLNDPDRYGLTLVLGGGEVRLLEMTSAYGVFANEGVRNKPTGILEITSQNGSVLESFRQSSARVLDKEVAVKINDVLSDNEARTPLWGSRSFMYHPGYDVAGKTGTTDNKVDAWMVGYTPEIAVGVWSGNNDNTPMGSGSGISGALWGEFMGYALTKTTGERFTPITESLPNEMKPILRGQWLGGESVFIDTMSGKLATEYTPQETLGEIVITDVHSILHWINKKDPKGPAPANPENDDQYPNWEFGVFNWWQENMNRYSSVSEEDLPTEKDDIHTEESIPEASFDSPYHNETISYGEQLYIDINYDSPINADLQKIDFFLGNYYLGTARNGSRDFSVTITEGMVSPGDQELKAVVVDEFFNKKTVSDTIKIAN
jgi:1A family penicillin-binding protein